MDYFVGKSGEVHCEGVSLRRLAEVYGTPCYVYSKGTLTRHLEEFKKAFADYPTLPCFAVKANSNLSILKEIFSAGFGADLVSLGELQRALKSGVNPKEVVFSGVGKREDEIRAGLSAGILAFNVESHFEFELIEEVARSMGLKASINIRVNPNIVAKTNPKIATGMYSSKFGIPEDEARGLIAKIKGSDSVELVGLACHIGSQITELQPLEEAAARMCSFAISLQKEGFNLKLIDMGGGLGIRYRSELPPSVVDYAEVVIKNIAPSGLRLLVEPGRVLAGNIGVLVSSVIGIKSTPEKKFVVIDGAMNDLLRPSMYDSYHDIAAVQVGEAYDGPVDFVGPICESGDFLGKDRMAGNLQRGDLVYVRSCGAYGFTMASNYNSRPKVAEVLVDGEKHKLIRRRETLEDLWKHEEEFLTE